MAGDIDIFDAGGEQESFESLGRDNGFHFWLASDLRQFLDYAGMQPIRAAVNRALATCAQLNIPIEENFVQTQTEGVGADWKLSRFACYLTVMNGDPKIAKVAQAQAYFITMAEAFRRYVQQADGVERVLVRGELSDREKALSATASAHGVENYAFFRNAGYRGMYNMDLKQIRARKGVPQDRSPLDYMGKEELAANLFRVTQTDAKIRNQDLYGQHDLERAASSVGKEVRDTMYRISGNRPEALPPQQDIEQVKRGLKHARKEFSKLDGPKPPKKPKA